MFGLGLPELIVFLIIFVAPATIGALIAKSKGRNILGWALLCVFFSLPAVIVLLFLSPIKEIEGKYRECPKCKELDE